MILLAALPLAAGSYKAKVEPYDAHTVSTEVSGRIVKLDQRDELKTLNKVVIEIDHALDDIQLANDRRKLKLLQEQIAVKQSQYDSIKDLASQNRFTKDQYKTELLALKMQAEDLQSVIAQLEDTIAKKRIALHGQYLKTLYVRQGEYVAPGTKLMKVEDHGGGRLVLYIDAADRAILDGAKVTVEGSSGWKIEKAATSTDETYVSYYRVDLVKRGNVPLGGVVSVTIEKP
ncbi:HlyD family efflux transporter periplasmic adaptor subunit [Sulfurimonas diazotrophicus]|uniref:HlyD family efflux transporter periplasmic adaptor subunit n=1 Tax=Sulfurimonas diazotrophicus TaxID=3131939 RepID=A0ABZ3H9K4_9BACT